MNIERTDFIKELAMILKDEFVAKVEQVDEKLKVQFLSGEIFWLVVE